MRVRQAPAEDIALNNIDVLSNDTDVEGDTLSVTGATAVNGTVTVNGDGTLNYTPNADFNGTDTSRYDIADGNGGTGHWNPDDHGHGRK